MTHYTVATKQNMTRLLLDDALVTVVVERRDCLLDDTAVYWMTQLSITG